MLGASLKFDGKFILQTKTDGPVDMIVADYVSPGKVSGYARFDAARVAALANPTQADLLGNGYLAMTVDQGPDMERYQGIVPLHGEDLTAAAHGYFEKSEQIPTRIRMAAGPLAPARRCGRKLAGRRHHGAAPAARGWRQPASLAIRRCPGGRRGSACRKTTTG